MSMDGNSHFLEYQCISYRWDKTSVKSLYGTHEFRDVGTFPCYLATADDSIRSNMLTLNVTSSGELDYIRNIKIDGKSISTLIEEQPVFQRGVPYSLTFQSVKNAEEYAFEFEFEEEDLFYTAVIPAGTGTNVSATVVFPGTGELRYRGS